MISLSTRYTAISVMSSKRTHSLSSLSVNDEDSVRAFFEDFLSHILSCGILDGKSEQFNIIFWACRVLKYSFQFDDNQFHRRIDDDTRLVAEYYDGYDGDTICLVLEENSSDRMTLTLYVELGPGVARQIIS